MGVLTGNEREQILRNVVPPGSRSVFPQPPGLQKALESPTRDHEAALLLNSYGRMKTYNSPIIYTFAVHILCTDGAFYVVQASPGVTC